MKNDSMLSRFLSAACLLFCQLVAVGQPAKVSENQRFLIQADGKPFFWLRNP